MKILIFLHGTTIMHRSAIGKTRAERVTQVLANEPSVSDYGSYVPVGNAAAKLHAWQKQGAEIVYLSSQESAVEVENDKSVLRKFGFPPGEVLFRQDGETYADIAEKVAPDVLIEDDCESIGDEAEMTITHVRPELKTKIRSIVVKEFEGIDNLADNIDELLKK
jgi:hypothetical protein